MGGRIAFTHHIKAILTTQLEHFEKGKLFRDRFDSLFGQGIFNVDGEMWKSITRQFFTRERLSDFDSVYDRNFEKSLELTRSRLTDGYPIDFQDVASRFTLDSATEFLFGHSSDSLSAGIPYPPSSAHKNSASFYSHPSNFLAEALVDSQIQSNIRASYGESWPWAEFWADKVAPLRRKMDDFIEPMMREALKNREERLQQGVIEKDEAESTLLAHLAKQTQDPTILKDEPISILVAGRDTTTSWLTFSVYVLTQRPDIEARLHAEIDELLGAPQRPTHENIKELKYVRAFLNEVLRLYPPVPFDSRTSMDSYVLLPGKDTSEPPTYVPANTTCFYSFLFMHRREDLWGPDALKFDPDRFLDERVQKYLTPNPIIFCPFNAGPRTCLGRQFAYHEATFFLVRLLQQFHNFRFEDDENIKPPPSWKAAEGPQGQDKIVPGMALTMFVKAHLLSQADSSASASSITFTTSQHQSFASQLSDWMEARKRGAVLPPLVTDTAMTVISKANEATLRGYPGEELDYYLKKYGKNTVSFHLFGLKMAFTIEPHNIKAILATEFNSFKKGPIMSEQFGSLLGTGIFNSDGEMWTFHRALSRPFFTRERISDFEIYARTSEKSLDEAQKRLKAGFSIDFQDLVGRFTLDSATTFLTGQNLDTLSADLPYPPNQSHHNTAEFDQHPSTPYLQSFNKGSYTTALRLNAGENWPLFEFWRDEVAECRKHINVFIEPIINEALATREKGGKGETSTKDEETTFLAHLDFTNSDPKLLMDALINLLFAARDTTTSLLSFSLYMLIENPHIEAKLRAEILKHVGASNTPTYENMREMKYMRAFLNEVLRLYPPTPFNSRMSDKSVALESPRGSSEPPLFISSGTTIIYSVFHMQRRKDLWGPDALVFDPDRFLDERLHKYLMPNPYIFSPFNAGPRICIGQQFAYHEATFYLVRLLQRFTKFKLDEETGVNVRPPASWSGMEGPQGRDRIMPDVGLTMGMRGGLWVKMEDLSLEESTMDV
ncbi:hypothetical protein CVT24_006507 [Panaeolus cyanescens]|uniref:Cytochrome P450 n=1 Tax=Panaeolus cyanescens TaxID=181874 RepID=A0A409VZT8_9AGAR|nr:hypothetical protein CVT24_006507 [Panaeolus cyanescens]